MSDNYLLASREGCRLHHQVILLVAKKISIYDFEAGEAEEELLLSSMEERDGSLGIVACAFDLDDFANAETFVLDLLAYGYAGGIAG